MMLILVHEFHVLELQIEMMMFFFTEAVMRKVMRKGLKMSGLHGDLKPKKKKETVVDHSPSFQAAVIIYENMKFHVLTLLLHKYIYIEICPSYLG